MKAREGGNAAGRGKSEEGRGMPRVFTLSAWPAPGACLNSGDPMPAPKKSPGKISPLLLAFAIPAAVLVFAVIVIVVRGGGKFGGLEEFPLPTYLREPETLRGNTYVIKGQIDSRLAYDEGKGAIIVVKLLDMAGGRVPVFVPEKSAGNLSVGQRFNIRVTVRRDRVEAVDMEKI